ncbi:unnamed protein product, partial [marine sediment metagenome]
QHFGGKMSFKELLVAERNVTKRIAELQGEGVSLASIRERGTKEAEKPEDKK